MGEVTSTGFHWGNRDENFESMGFWAGTIDFLHHMCLPLICFMASEFAFLTMLMKNSLLEEIRKEYVRTAMLKGQASACGLEAFITQCIDPTRHKNERDFYPYVCLRSID